MSLQMTTVERELDAALMEVDSLRHQLVERTELAARLLVLIQKHNADCDFHQMPKWKIALATPEGEDIAK
jgi:hypothetical protein